MILWNLSVYASHLTWYILYRYLMLLPTSTWSWVHRWLSSSLGEEKAADQSPPVEQPVYYKAWKPLYLISRCIIILVRSYIRCLIRVHVNLGIHSSLKWLVSEAPYLIEQTAIAPDITGSGVFLVVNGFWSCPLHWYLASLWYVVRIICQISRHTKICNLV